MQFEWDETKNEQNISKHGIDFADVYVLFEYFMLTKPDDRFDYDEHRWISIGTLGPGYAVVVWTERDDDRIRIISARRANKDERRRYEAFLKNQLGEA